MTKTDRQNFLSKLQEYVDLGLPIIPLCAHDHKGYSKRHRETCNHAGKVPLIKGWQYHEATTMKQVRSWMAQFNNNINVGLPLGHVSGFVGIDVDGEVGEELLYEMSNGDLPETWEFVTAAGRRLLYQIPVGMKTKKHVNVGEGDHEECSILAAGQQTVLPPSIHRSGVVYEWVEGRSPDDIDCAPAPRWLLDLIRVDDEPGGRGFTKSAKGQSYAQQDEEEEEEPEVRVVSPIIVSDKTLPAEFSAYEEIEFDPVPPDDEYTGGKKAKTQKSEEDSNKVTPEELLQKITAGNRDVQMTRIIGSFCAQFRHLGKDYVMFMAKNHNRQFVDPPLDDLAIEAKVNHFWEMEEMKSSQIKAAIEEEKKQFSPAKIAQVAINKLESDGYILKVDPEQPIIWMTRKEKGPWKPVDARSSAFQVYLAEPLGNPELGGDDRWTTVRHYKDVANAVVVALRMQHRIWETHTTNVDTQTMKAFKYIPLADGKLLDWETGELKPWDPETNLTYALPIEYDPEAKAEAWQRRLDEWLPDKGSQAILQEFIGYSLIPYMGFEVALSIQGEGANGKSIFLETIQGLLGYEVVSSINMRTLFSRFGQASLVGKILNIVNEAGSEYLRGSYADDFKNLISGGRVTADVKNQAPISFNNTAKFIFSSNHDIKTGDKSEGWLRRLLIVPFEQDFRDSTVPKYEIMEELRAEYPGIFNWAVEGLRRLMKNKKFSVSESAERKKRAYIQENDIAADFFMNCLEIVDLAEIDPDGKPVKRGTPSVLINALFSEWVEYRESSVQRKIDHITKYLEKKHNLKKRRTKHMFYLNKTMTECWIGLRLRIRDTGFLEYLINEPIPRFPELKEYAQKRLEEIDRYNEENPDRPTPDPPTTIGMPEKKAQ